MEAKPRRSTLTTAEKEIVRIVPQRFRGAVEQILEGGRADEIRFIIDRPMQAAGRRGEQVFCSLNRLQNQKHVKCWRQYAGIRFLHANRSCCRAM